MCATSRGEGKNLSHLRAEEGLSVQQLKKGRRGMAARTKGSRVSAWRNRRNYDQRTSALDDRKIAADAKKKKREGT